MARQKMRKNNEKPPAKTRNKPVKKFARREYSEKRLKKTEWVRSNEILKRQSSRIFATAEKIISLKMPKDFRIVFLGLRMRPLFETVRAINEQKRNCKRSQIRYFIMPARPAGSLVTSEQRAAYVEKIYRKMLELDIVSKAAKGYYLVDFTHTGRNFLAVTEAISKARQVEIKYLNQHFEGFSGITESEKMSTAHHKDTNGKPITAKQINYTSERKWYLAFQQALGEYLDKKFPERKEK
jgi:hypothetical protein